MKIKFRSFEDFESQALEAMEALDRCDMEAVKQSSDPEDVIFFGSHQSFQKFFSSQKIELLVLIKANNPGSIYELANLAGRGFPSVLKDIKTLEGLGFIKLAPTGDKRNSKKPQLSFDYDTIVVEMPSAGYSISFAA